MLPSEVPRFATDSPVRVFPGVWKLLSFLRLPSQDGSLSLHDALPIYGHGFGWTPGVGDRQGGLACCGSWGRKESDMTEQLN